MVLLLHVDGCGSPAVCFVLAGLGPLSRPGDRSYKCSHQKAAAGAALIARVVALGGQLLAPPGQHAALQLHRLFKTARLQQPHRRNTSVGAETDGDYRPRAVQLQFTEAALEAAGKGHERLISAVGLTRQKLANADASEAPDDAFLDVIQQHKTRFLTAMDDDFKTPEALAVSAVQEEMITFCQARQAQFDATADREVFADAPWIPSEMKEVVTVLLGCGAEESDG